MKKTVFLLVLSLLTINTYSQLFESEGKRWNPNKAVKKAGDRPIFIIDEKKDTSSSFIDLNPNDIASLTVYGESKKLRRKYNASKMTSGYIRIITKSYAINYYQPHLSEISSDYKALVQNYSKENDSIIYVADGEVISPNVEGKLYELRFKKIKEIIVIPSDKAKNDYGNRCKFGVVILKSKKFLKKRH
jgi:hypothetical protein